MFKKSLLIMLVLAFAITVIAADDTRPRMHRQGSEGEHMGMGPGHGGGGFGFDSWLFPGKWWKIPKVKEELALTDNQIAKLDDLFLQHKTEMIDLKADLEKKQLELSNLFDKDTVDDAVILQKVDDLIAAKGVLQKSYIKMLLAMKKVLVPDQVQKLKDLRMKVHSEMEMRHRQFRRQEAPQEPPSK